MFPRYLMAMIKLFYASILVLLQCQRISLLIVGIASGFSFIAMMLIHVAKLNKKKTKLPTKHNCLLDVKDFMSKNLPITSIFTRGKLQLSLLNTNANSCSVCWLSTKALTIECGIVSLMETKAGQILIRVGKR